VVQRTSSDLRLNPHLHLVVLDGAWYEAGGELAWEKLSHLGTSEVGEVLERLVRRIERHLRRCGLLGTFGDEAEPDGEGDGEGNLAASAVWGQRPPAGPQWVSRLAPLEPHALAYDKPLCASLDGFTLHAATRAGAFHPAGREALLRYALRPALAQERVELRPDGLVRITLKKAYADGTTGRAASSAGRRSVRWTTVRAPGCRRPRSRGVENGGRATGRRSLRIEPDRGHPASSREGPASQSRARRGWQPPGMGRPEEAC
jgi:hypothetical protein